MSPLSHEVCFTHWLYLLTQGKCYDQAQNKSEGDYNPSFCNLELNYLGFECSCVT